ncbi:hypothetical protein [Lichenicoccus roseus]|uniref:Glycosyltransferase RgtA/B/C/D-like domain-containing protein n=1 Tax=Lichenicoccus roseus TaxID=2683649 RepID=A0A5R9J275_9PROT|nr:hypothetical protein [Lichenicoccus roseus]TLU71735.1 hypothetical protein FE263_14805 [Lichenicoccus roseus]
MLTGLLLLAPILTIPLHIPVNYNEGWNAAFDLRAIHPSAGPLYPGPGSFVFNNYPPLGFYLVGAAGWLAGDMIAAGRLVALAALFCCAGLLGLCVRRLGASAQAAMAATVLFLLVNATYYQSYVAMDDPQWLAHAFMLAGLAVLLREGPPSVPLLPVVLAALLVTAGGFVKHNLVALPLAATLWLLWHDRRQAAAWIATAVVATGAGVVAIQARYGAIAFADILHHARTLDADRLILATGALAPLLPMALAVVLLLRRGGMLVALFGGLALAAGILQRLGDGVNYNAHFETLIAACLGFGLVLDPLVRSPLRLGRVSIGPAALLVFAALPMLCAMPIHLPAAWNAIASRERRQAAWQPVIARLAAAPGPVGCEMPSLCIWAGKPFSVDIFNLTQSILSGRPEHPFQAMVRRGGFGMFEYDPAASTHADAIRRMGHDPIMAPFAGRYREVATGPGGAVLLSPIPGRSLFTSP